MYPALNIGLRKIDMASERQIAANRRNAKKSTGPRSAFGKKRSNENAHRYGLAKPISSADFEEQLERLARQIAGDSDDIATLVLARVAAEAQLQLLRVKQVKKALIERATIFGRLDGPRYFRSELAEMRWLLAEIEWREGKRRSRPPTPVVLNPSAPLPEDESERAAEATRRILLDLARVGRYENRAAGRRDRAVRTMIKMTSTKREMKIS
jgi:hypothetical protein